MSAGADPGVDSDVGQEQQYRSVWDYDSAAERAKDVHIRDLDTEPRWNGHAPVPTTAYGTEMKVSKMIVCKHCGETAETRDSLGEKAGCSDQ